MKTKQNKGGKPTPRPNDGPGRKPTLDPLWTPTAKAGADAPEAGEGKSEVDDMKISTTKLVEMREKKVRVS